jgi:hypothetical protein
MPIPITGPVEVISVSMPHIFILPQTMSLTHFILLPAWQTFSIARRTATAPHAVISLISSGVASPVPSKKER